ncbi:DUF7344 domain-containing protein [Haloarcula laminariae]|uniref:DUF7344 domain-containing protein n=1 Tax=Haloarcula laminariae TaxID=2961577 RepID=UPI0021C9B062|nr:MULTISPECIES: hypothetical protein [Halomicroarcula]
MNSHHSLSDLDEPTRHRLLADGQRRLVIESLDTATGGVDTTLEDIAVHLEREAERTGDESVGCPAALRCRLHHVHLPMLDDLGLLAYDAATKRVSPERREVAAAGKSA